MAVKELGVASSTKKYAKSILSFMNSKFLVWISLLIAILLHLALFNQLTFVFRIDPESLKPKFFFLGQILSKNNDMENTPQTSDAKLYSSYKDKKLKTGVQNSMGLNIIDQEKSPFDVNFIKKPEMPLTGTLHNKTSIKSTFETLSEINPSEEIEKKRDMVEELNIRPYKPLKFQTP